MVDPETRYDGPAGLWIERGELKKIARTETERQALRARVAATAPEALRLEADGLLVFPGLVDLHVHLREPGFEYKETIRTGCEAAARGGFTAICCMANTNPVNDCRAVTEFICARAAEVSGVAVHPIGAISKGLEGKELAEIAEMKKGGIVAVSDDGRPVADSALMRRALEYARTFDLRVVSHAEDKALAGSGCMHEGAVSTRLGLEGIPAEAEEIMVARDIHLAALTGARLHIAHVSTAGSVELVRRAKEKGLDVTAEAAPHHLLLTDEVLGGSGAYDTRYKMNPPLRASRDMDALRRGLQDGTIDCIATDHAPHSEDDKNVEFHRAPFGVVGLETALAAGLSLVRSGTLSLAQLAERMSLGPARLFGLPHGRIAEGRPISLAVIDPNHKWTVDARRFRSKSRNSAFEGWTFEGDVAYTLAQRRLSYAAEWARPLTAISEPAGAPTQRRIAGV
ncbi:MAG: dihydroorotase [Nitrospirae bacterium]|nr:dihydroorotase [Nitrospirota bacterium]MBI4241509.1 dihydroorotase [Candidatus Rokubacteria bacterium]